MAYYLEELGDTRFQKLCQTILTTLYPDVQCLPVDQPDGGRDSFLRHQTRTKHNEFTVFQVKFVRNHLGQDARNFIKKIASSEKEKINRLIARGATKYYLMTNVSGTSHLDVGSIDQVNKVLSEKFGITTFCWWRDDLERRIDSMPAIRWNFLEILRATDLLQALLVSKDDSETERRIGALRAYMAYQGRYDAQLKFKQIDLQKNIIDLFVDVPVRMLPSPSILSVENRSKWINDERQKNSWVFSEEGILEETNTIHSSGTLQLLIEEDFSRDFTKIVIEGAPGQGKSTVTQYLCQIHRLFFLNSAAELGYIPPEHRPSAARIPFRVDLRDYANWLSGRNPFSHDASIRIPSDSSLTLESFLAAQVHYATGASFTVDDLRSISQKSHILIVLDGFDEVADINLRKRIVAEVSDSATRIQANAFSVQIIVTSRPAAFANSPGFPRNEWQHLEMLSLSRSIIKIYANKWLDVRGADEREKKEVLLVLEEKLEQPHVRDLARNPMQLAILLALISVQGTSLPDKRTALYDKYIDIFLNRESEKSKIVRNHRDLLIQIHRFLAWELQAEAEISGTGHITEERLKETLRNFLERVGHPSKLVEDLFSGVIERVVVLVSRIQGTFEFEVQPLREYFAARHLYDTIPYSPSGTLQQRGTQLDRFEAIAKNFYWLNVTRFYAGCYNTGELSSLIDGLENLSTSEQFRYIGYPGQLGIILLGDYVFSQYPKLGTKLIKKITDNSSFVLLLSEKYLNGIFIIPQGESLNILINKCKSIIENEKKHDLQYYASKILSLNMEKEDIYEYWLKLREILNNDASWVQVGSFFDVFKNMPPSQALDLACSHGLFVIVDLIINRKTDSIANSKKINDILMKYTLDYCDNIFPIWRIFLNNPKVMPLNLPFLHLLLLIESMGKINSKKNNCTLRQFIDFDLDILGFSEVKKPLIDKAPSNTTKQDHADTNFVQLTETLLNHQILDLRKNIYLWSSIVEAGRTIWGDRWAFYRLATTAADFLDIPFLAEKNKNISDMPLCDRALLYKINANNLEWWKEHLLNIKNENPKIINFIFLSINKWMPINITLQLSDQLSQAIDGLDDNNWEILTSTIKFSNSENIKRIKKSNIRNSDLPNKISLRLICFLLAKINKPTKVRIWNLFLQNYKGKDHEVIKAAIIIAVELAQEKRANWNTALLLIAHGYTEGVNYYRFPNHDNIRVPHNEARKICSSPGEFPLNLVSISEDVLFAETGAAAIPVSKIAARDEWFSPL